MHHLSTDKLLRTHPDIEINTSNTLELTTFNNKSFLDASNHRQLKFRIKLLTASLTTKSLLLTWNKVQDNKCPVCTTQPESQDHMFLCTYTISQFPLLLSQTKESYISNFKLQYPSHPPNFNSLAKIIGLDTIKFLSTPAAKGIITTQLLKNYMDLKKTMALPRIKNVSALRPLYILLDCWLSSVYSLIWKPRCDILYNKANPGKTQTLNDLHSTYNNTTSHHQHNYLPSYQTSLSPPSSITPLSSPLKPPYPQK